MSYNTSPISPIMHNDQYAKVVYEVTEDKADFIFREFDEIAEHFESVKASNVIGKKLTSVFPAVKEFGLFDKLLEVFDTGRSTIHPNTLYKDGIHSGWRRNVIVKSSDNTLTVWYEDTEVEFNTHNSVEMFKRILQYTSDAVSITDSEANIEYANKQFIKNTGYTEEELIGSNMSLLKSGEYDDLFYQNMWIQLNNYQVFESDLINKNKKGDFFIDHTIIIPIYGEDKVITNFVTIKKDITDEILKEQVFRSHIREAQMGEMISIIAHQWKQPLGVISSNNATLRIQSELNKLTSEKLQIHCESVETVIKSMISTMDDFRNFYAPSENQEFINLKKLIDDTIFLIKGELFINSIDLQLVVDEQIQINTYKNEIKQVFINLIKNFIDIVVEKKVQKPKLIISTIEKENSLEISFEDNGGGINDEHLAKIFKPYFTTKSKEKGTGLGLYMSKLVIEEHCNGHIKVQNANDGALFTITMNKI